MTPDSIACRLRTLRQRSGLSELDVAQILGFHSEVPVSRHERSARLPELLTALGYEVIFRVAIADIFPGLHQTVEAVIEERLAALEKTLEESTAKGRAAPVIARKLEFLCERKELDSKTVQ